MLVIIDNYDSFTYNLVQYFLELNIELKVFRNDQASIETVKQLNPSHIVISPGPGAPIDSKLSWQLVAEFAGKVPLLGVCLGHQIIAEVFGAKVIEADRIMHGKTSQIKHDHSLLFKEIPNPCRVTRYHSLIIDPTTLPNELVVTALAADKNYQGREIMAIAHRLWPLYGVQFHPESILTEHGHQLLQNFLTGSL
jgi:para-aminobenzoate synthetase component II